MPNIITHTLFADEMLDLLQDEELTSRRQLFEIGSNGPDILFFHHMNPVDFAKKTRLHWYGSELHKDYIDEFYRSALHAVWREKNSEIRKDMIAYVCGHLCHWALDSCEHPYIFYRTGTCQGKSASYHHRFESILDSLMLKLKRNQTIKDYDVTKIVTNPTVEMIRPIARVYVPAIREVFEEDVRPSEIAETIHDWNFMQKLFRDPSGRKIRGFQLLEKPFGMDNQFSGFAVPPVPEDNYDIMNLLHNEWKNPQTGECSTESVLDLYQKAIKRASKAIVLFLNAAAHPGNAKAETEFIDYLGNRNYEMGTSHPGERIYFDIADLSV